MPANQSGMSEPVEPGWDLIERMEIPGGATFQAEAKQLPGADKIYQWKVWRFNPSHTVPQGHIVRQGQEKSREAAWEKARAALKEVMRTAWISVPSRRFTTGDHLI